MQHGDVEDGGAGDVCSDRRAGAGRLGGVVRRLGALVEQSAFELGACDWRRRPHDWQGAEVAGGGVLEHGDVGTAPRRGGMSAATWGHWPAASTPSPAR